MLVTCPLFMKVLNYFVHMSEGGSSACKKLELHASMRCRDVFPVKNLPWSIRLVSALQNFSEQRSFAILNLQIETVST